MRISDWSSDVCSSDLPHVLLTNFGGYLDMFCTLIGATVQGADRPMPSATHDGITMINFGMGSANAATVMDLLTAYEPKAVLFQIGRASCRERVCQYV